MAGQAKYIARHLRVLGEEIFVQHAIFIYFISYFRPIFLWGLYVSDEVAPLFSNSCNFI